ncbi:MAG: hypothetical protein PUF44_07625, partial [Bacteroidales bacterium]|nr:hypothetical protein [Bacteroidales bacterium]
DTRIFSPLLYQLSYGTVLFCDAKVEIIFLAAKGKGHFFYVKVEKRGENTTCFVKKEATLRLCVTF